MKKILSIACLICLGTLTFAQVEEVKIQEEAVQEEAVQQEIIQEETIPEEPIREAVTQEETISEEPIREEVIQEKVIREKEIQEEPRQDEIKTLFQRGKRGSVGGYGELSMLYTQIDNQDAFIFGARAGVLLGHAMTLGFCGSGFFNNPTSYTGITEEVSIAGGYGGIYFEPILFPKFPVHIAIPITVGVGGVGAARMYDPYDWDDYDNYDDFYVEESDAYMVIEPGVELELNFTKWFRFSIGGYYRYTTDIDLKIGETTMPSDLLRGFSGGINFKFGKF